MKKHMKETIHYINIILIYYTNNNIIIYNTIQVEYKIIYYSINVIYYIL